MYPAKVGIQSTKKWISTSKNLCPVQNIHSRSHPSHLVAWAFGSESFNSRRILHLTSPRWSTKGIILPLLALCCFLERSLGKFPSRWSWSITSWFWDLGVHAALEALKCAPQCFFLPLRVTRVEPWHPQPETARAGRCQAVSTQHLVRRKQHANGGAMGKDPGKKGTTGH